jgi:hypothetical protein
MCKLSAYKVFTVTELYRCMKGYKYTGYTQKNGAVLIVFTIKTAPLFCVCPVFVIIN